MNQRIEFTIALQLYTNRSQELNRMILVKVQQVKGTLANIEINEEFVTRFKETDKRVFYNQDELANCILVHQDYYCNIQPIINKTRSCELDM